MNRYGVSIIICCHNGSRRLPETIRHIAGQIVPPTIPWEFILIDNGSTDDSVELTVNEWNKYIVSAPLRIVNEPRLGLSHARARGFAAARYEFMIMCDDDNWLSSDYVEQTYNIMFTRSNIGALGGLGKLMFEITPPAWIEHAHIFAAGEQNPFSGKVLQNKLYGAGCVIRKSAYFKLLNAGFKSLLSDRKGNELSSGGDYELCYALAIMGYDIWYDERLRFSHFITKERLTWNYFIRYAKESCKCFDVLSSYKLIAGDFFLNRITILVLLKEWLYCIRYYSLINLRRLLTASNSTKGKVLIFKHIVYQYKTMTYYTRFTEMIRRHNEILSFKNQFDLAPLPYNKVSPTFSGDPSNKRVTVKRSPIEVFSNHTEDLVG